ncbi:hypothetical protein GCM10028793_21310 [Nocardiopsis oceani]
MHCASEQQARHVLQAIKGRMGEVGLELHPDKTKVVYCKDEDRTGDCPDVEFTFLGFTFRQRASMRWDGSLFLSFSPAVSKQALKRMSAQVRSWRLQHRTGHSSEDLARKINPIVRGWMSYCGAFNKWELFPLLKRINAYLMRWMRNKYERLGGAKKAQRVWDEGVRRKPRYFAQWEWTVHAPRSW